MVLNVTWVSLYKIFIQYKSTFYHIVQKLGTLGGTISGLDATKLEMLFSPTKSDKIDLVSVGDRRERSQQAFPIEN